MTRGLVGQIASLLAAAGRTWALRTTGESGPPQPLDEASTLARLDGSGPALRNGTAPGAYAQRLQNYGNLMYFLDFRLGGQPLSGLVDTGSSELLAFPSACASCGAAAAYDEQRSAAFARGARRAVQSYGSGECEVEDGSDDVVVGPFSADGQAFWRALKCSMQILDDAGFNAVVGLGPPAARDPLARQALAAAAAGLERYASPPPDRPGSAAGLAGNGGTVKLERLGLRRNLGVASFSVCFGRHSLSPGWLIWNDAPPDGVPTVATSILEGREAWAVRLGSLGLELAGGSSALGCGGGCGAVLDTGTSLLGVPGDIYMALQRVVDETPGDCTSLDGFPDLVLRVGGQALHLPPRSYVGNIFGSLRARTRKFLRLRRESHRSACQLLLLDLGNETTQFGPMVLLGVPFFREFYATLGLEGGSAAAFAPAAEGCRPGGVGLERRDRALSEPLRVDASLIRVPRWLGPFDSDTSVE